MSYQGTIPGIEPRPQDTPYGAMVLELRARFGFTWPLRIAHWIQYGERNARVTQCNARAVQRAHGNAVIREEAA